MATLCNEARGVCAAIVAAPEAWSSRAEVEGRLGAAAVLCALAAGAVAVWMRPDYPAITLTPWGAWAMGVEVKEVWREGRESREEWDESRPAKPPKRSMVAVQVETPVWVGVGHAPRPVRMPAHARIGTSLIRPECVAAPRAGPEFLTDDAGEPVKVLGLPVRIDRRIRG